MRDEPEEVRRAVDALLAEFGVPVRADHPGETPVQRVRDTREPYRPEWVRRVVRIHRPTRKP